MQLHLEGQPVDLTYCTNVHAAEDLDELLEILDHDAPALKARLSPDAPFGLGLRLSDRQSRELVDDERMPELCEGLAAHGLYVPTINGFPFGAFHGTRVKEQVHAPDWRTDARADYTLRLATILAALLPDGAEGGVSTNPLTYRAWVDASDPALWSGMVERLAVVVEGLARLRDDTGRTIHLDLEPEPDGLIETGAELADFYEDELLRLGVPALARRMGGSDEAAAEAIRRHVRVCLDACHAAVLFEDLDEVVDRYDRRGIGIGRLQISSALRLVLPDDLAARRALAGRLEAFADGVYLHQVAAMRRDGAMARFSDLPDALAAIDNTDLREWRIHVHVPIFEGDFGGLGSTQPSLEHLLQRMRARPFTRHLEIETYTWAVLPQHLRADLLDSIEREYNWVRHVLD